MKSVAIECPHCGHKERDWKDGSAWCLERPVGEYKCWSCGEWIKVVLGTYEPHAFKTWEQADLAASLLQKRTDRSVPTQGRGSDGG